MEHIGAIFEGEWNFLNGMSSEEAEFMEQLLGNCSLPNEAQNNTNCPVSVWPSDENIAGVVESTMYSADGTSTSVYSFSQGSSYFPSVSDHVFVGNNDLMAMDYCMEDKNDSIESNINMCEDVLQGTKTESKKRSRIPREGGRNVNKCAKVVREEDNNNKDDNAVVVNRQNSSSCSEDDSNASHVVTHSSSSKGKTRANRGSATDPQSLYARKRRERINERLKILQKLVPNGTKVDISTMLEEAVQYVKFLQLQIKLLSSDDMWMYAPIAYNGMDIGLDLKISTLRPQS